MHEVSRSRYRGHADAKHLPSKRAGFEKVPGQFVRMYVVRASSDLHLCSDVALL